MKTIINIKTVTILVAGLAFFTSSCNPEEVDPIPTEKVTFDFTSPTPGQMFGLGDTVNIDGMMSSESMMHGFEFEVVNTAMNDSVVYHAHKHMDSKMIHVHDYWINNVKHHSNMELRIHAITSHFEEKETKVIPFHCHPM